MDSTGRAAKLSAKFNLIDLAGSERAKRTGATGGGEGRRIDLDPFLRLEM